MLASIPVLLAGILAIAAERGPEGPRGPQQRGGQDISAFVDKVIEAVNATDEQTTQLKAIADEHQKAATAAREKAAALTDEQREQVKTLRQKMREARRDGKTEEVENLQTQIHEIIGSNPLELVKTTHEKIVAVLTAEQRPAFQELVEAQRQGRGRGDDFGGRGRPGERDRGFMLERFIERVIEEVDATEAQQEQLQAIGKEHAEAAKAARDKAQAAREENREKLDALREQMREAIKDGDEEEATKLRAEMQALVGMPDRDELLQPSLDKMGKVLTDEQKPAFDAMVAELKERLAASPRGMGGERGPGAGRGDGRGAGRGGPRGIGRTPPEQPETDDE